MNGFPRSSQRYAHLQKIIALACAWLILVFFHTSTTAQKRPPPTTAPDIRARTLEPAIKLLNQRKVPFNPRLLIETDWREKLAPAFAQMPEMKTDIRVVSPMKGAYVARTILLPEQVLLEGDTVILAQDFAPIDENTTIHIHGQHRIIIYVVGDPKQYQNMRQGLRRNRSGQFLTIDVDAPCGIVGIPPIFIGRKRCMGMGFVMP